MQHCITARRSQKVSKQTAAATREALPVEADTQESGGGDGQRLKEVTGEKTKGVMLKGPILCKKKNHFTSVFEQRYVSLACQ